MFTFVDKKHADYRKLEQAVQRVLELVHQAVETPASYVDQESLFNREVNAGIGHQEQDKISSSVRAILNEVGNGTTPAEEEEEDNGIQIESSTAVNATPRDNNVHMGGNVVVNKAIISLSPDHAKDSSPQDADERKHVSAYGTGFPLSFTIDPNLEWKIVFSILRQNGWKWLNGKIIYDKVLVKPGCNYKGGKVGEDFFPTDTCGHGDEIKEYMKENSGWVGPILESSNSEESNAQVEANGEDDDYEFVDDADSEHDQMVDDATNSGGQGGIPEHMDVPMIVETKRSDDLFDFKDDDEDADVIDYGYMPWMLVWQSMHSHGWRVARGPGDELYYFRPGVDSMQGEYGEAFVYEEDVKNIAKEEFGWKGEKPPRASAKRNAVVSTEKPSKKPKHQKKLSPASENSNRSKKHNSSVKTLQKKSSWAAKKKRTDDDKGRTWDKARKTAAASPERVTWKSLNTEGWTAKRAGGYNILHDWYYIRPGFSLSKGAKLNEHYFETENAAIKYATDHLNQSKKSPFTSSEASEPSAQVLSSQPASPLETDCVMEESSSLNTDDSSTKKSYGKRQDSPNDGQDRDLDQISDNFSESQQSGNKRKASIWESEECAKSPTEHYQLGNTIIPEKTYQVIANALAPSGKDLVAMFEKVMPLIQISTAMRSNIAAAKVKGNELTTLISSQHLVLFGSDDTCQFLHMAIVCLAIRVLIGYGGDLATSIENFVENSQGNNIIDEMIFKVVSREIWGAMILDTEQETTDTWLGTFLQKKLRGKAAVKNKKMMLLKINKIPDWHDIASSQLPHLFSDRFKLRSKLIPKSLWLEQNLSRWARDVFEIGVKPAESRTTKNSKMVILASPQQIQKTMNDIPGAASASASAGKEKAKKADASTSAGKKRAPKRTSATAGTDKAKKADASAIATKTVDTAKGKGVVSRKPKESACAVGQGVPKTASVDKGSKRKQSAGGQDIENYMWCGGSQTL